MSLLLKARIALSLIGLILFVYGVRIDDDRKGGGDDRIRWMGVGFLAGSVVLRVWRGRRPPVA